MRRMKVALLAMIALACAGGARATQPGLRTVQGTLEAALPAALAEQCRVANCKDGTLVVSTRNGATAVRLKQMLPSLLEHFARTGHVLDTIKVKVGTPEQVEWRAPPPERHGAHWR